MRGLCDGPKIFLGGSALKAVFWHHPFFTCWPLGPINPFRQEEPQTSPLPGNGLGLAVLGAAGHTNLGEALLVKRRFQAKAGV